MMTALQKHRCNWFNANLSDLFWSSQRENGKPFPKCPNPNINMIIPLWQQIFLLDSRKKNMLEDSCSVENIRYRTYWSDIITSHHRAYLIWQAVTRLAARHKKYKRQNHAVISNRVIVTVKLFWQLWHLEIIGQYYKTQQSDERGRPSLWPVTLPQSS